MPQFSYRARNAQGGLVEGVLDCPDRAVAIRQIEQLRYIPVRIEAVGSEPQAVAKGQSNGATKGCRRRASGANAKAKNSAQPVAHFYRATWPFAPGGDDAG